MKYRIELDALNALVDEQRKTNELLAELIERTSDKPITAPQSVVKPDKRQYQRRKAQ